MISKKQYTCKSIIIINYTNTYRFLSRLVVLVEPKRSICTNCNGLQEEMIFFCLKEFLIVFPFDMCHINDPFHILILASHKSSHCKIIF